MKNLFRFAMAVAVLFTASCAKEDISSSIGGGEVEVTFTANLADLGTRAIGDGTKANEVYLAIYEAGTNNALDKEIIDPTKPIDVVDKKASISVVLLKDKKYDLVFWAQNSSLDCFELNVENRYMEIDYTGAKSQVEKSDAFFLVRNDWQAGKDKTTFDLHRPFAQLNVGLSENERNKVIKNGVDVEKLYSKAVVEDVYNVLDLGYANPGAVSCSDDFNGTVTFKFAEKPEEALSVSGVNYEYLSMNYLLVDKTNIDVTYTFVEKDAEGTKYIRPYYNVPLQRNYRTNIVGNLLSSEYDFNVIIVPGFDGDNDTTVEYPEEGKLENLITPNLSKKSAQIILQSDVTWTTDARIGFTPLIPEGAALKDLTIQGGEVSRAGEQPKIIFNGDGVGAVRAANGGTITFRNVTIVDESESYAENSWEYGYLELGGKLVFEDCTFVNAMMFEGTEATFTNCNFNSNKDSEYALWVSDGDVTVSESTIEGPRGIKVHEAYGSEVASVAIDKCQFKGISKKPALAIGDVNADTAISITNCTIDAQPGDQGLYIYETDTDVTTFNFTCENNTLVAKEESLADVVSKPGATVTIPAGEYTFPTGVAAGVTINAEGAVFTGSSNLNINGATVIGATFSNPSGNASRSTINGTFKNCTFEGSNGLRYCYTGETCVFEDCVFSGDVYGAHFDGGDHNVTFTRCQFSGFNAFGSEIPLLTMNECTFKSNGKSGYNGANLWGATVMNNTIFAFDGQASTEWIGLNAAGSGKIIALNGCKALDADKNELSLLDYMANYDDGYQVTINGVVYTLYEDGSYVVNGDLVVPNADVLKTALAKDGVTNIALVPGVVYEGTFNVNRNVNIKSVDANNKATIKGRVEIRSVNPTFNNVKFDRNETDSNNAMQTASNALQYKAVVMIYGDQTNTITFEGCDFYNNRGTHKSAITNVACDLVVNNCYFEGYSSGIYSQANLSVTNSTFNYTGGNNVILSINGCGDNGGKVIFKNNTITNKIFALSQFLSTVGFDNGTYYFDVQGNTGAGFEYYFLNEDRVANKTFADGSETF